MSSQPDKVSNSCLVYDDKGNQVARYDKIHLFGLELGNESYAEEKTIEAGCGVVALESPFGRIGLSICYDLRFPELYRSMGKVDIIFAPAAFTATTGKAHWETLSVPAPLKILHMSLRPLRAAITSMAGKLTVTA